MSFASAAVRLQDSLFARGGSDALWKSGGEGDGVPCKVILAEPDAVQRLGQDRVILSAAQFRVRKSEVDQPAEGDTIDILDDDGDVTETLKIVAEPLMDKHRIVFTCEAQRQ